MTADYFSRRHFLKSICSIATASAVPSVSFAMPVHKGSRTLKFYNRHTGERVSAEFWHNGQYELSALKSFDQILRDHRQNIAAPMDRRLFELLYLLEEKLETDKEIHIISGYRSPKTNQMLAARSNGVAKNSYHTKGMAMDIAIPGIDVKHVRNAALSLKLGGVGFYPSSGFVHVDTGRVRRW